MDSSMKSEGVLALLLPKTGLTVALVTESFQSSGVLDTPRNDSLNNSRTIQTVKVNKSTSPPYPRRPSFHYISPPRDLLALQRNYSPLSRNSSPFHRDLSPRRCKPSPHCRRDPSPHQSLVRRDPSTRYRLRMRDFSPFGRDSSPHSRHPSPHVTNLAIPSPDPSPQYPDPSPHHRDKYPHYPKTSRLGRHPSPRRYHSSPIRRLHSPPRRLRGVSLPARIGERKRCSEKRYSRNVDARYLSFMNYIEKVTNPNTKTCVLPTCKSCNSWECPYLQQRLFKHRQKYHSPNPQGAAAQTTLTISEVGDITLSIPDIVQRNSTIKFQVNAGNNINQDINYTQPYNDTQGPQIPTSKLVQGSDDSRNVNHRYSSPNKYTRPYHDPQRSQSPTSKLSRGNDKSGNVNHKYNSPNNYTRPYNDSQRSQSPTSKLAQGNDQSENVNHKYNSPNNYTRTYNDSQRSQSPTSKLAQGNDESETVDRRYISPDNYTQQYTDYQGPQTPISKLSRGNDKSGNVNHKYISLNNAGDRRQYMNKNSGLYKQKNQAIATDKDNKANVKKYGQMVRKQNVDSPINEKPEIGNTFDDQSRLNKSVAKYNLPNNQHGNNITDKPISIKLQSKNNAGKNSPPTDIILKINPAKNNPTFKYRHDIQTKVKEWLSKIPLDPTDSPDDVRIQENAINELIDNITNLMTEIDKDGYDEQLGREIDKCLNTLNNFFPKDKSDQIKKDIHEQLLDKILTVNKQLTKDQLSKNIDDSKTSGKRLSKLNSKPKSNSKCFVDTSICTCDGKLKSPICMKNFECSPGGVSCIEEIENVLNDCSNRIQLQKLEGFEHIDMKVLENMLKQRLAPFFHKPSSLNNKAILTDEIKMIFQELKIGKNLDGEKKQTIHRFAEDLGNRLTGVHARVEYSGKGRRGPSTKYKSQFFDSSWTCLAEYSRSSIPGSKEVKPQKKVSDILKEELFEGIDRGSSEKNNIGLSRDILNILLDQIDDIRNNKNEAAKKQIASLLQSSEQCTRNFVKKILDSVLDVITSVGYKKDFKTMKCDESDTLSIHASEKELYKGNGVSIESISDVVRSWLENWSSNFQGLKDSLKEIMTCDLACEIINKVSQNGEYQIITSKEFEYFIAKWLEKFEVHTDRQSSKVTKALISSLRQLYAAHALKIEFNRVQTKFKDLLSSVNSAKNLENKIIDWINQQPSYLFKASFKERIRNCIKNLALNINSRLSENHNDVVIQEEIAKWLQEIVDCEEKNIITNLSRDLCLTLKQFDKDLIIMASVEVNKTKASNEKQNSSSTVIRKSSKNKRSGKDKTDSESQEKVPLHNRQEKGTHTDQTAEIDTDKAIVELITKYVQSNHNVDDLIARAAFSTVLIKELQNLCLSTRKEIYENFNTGLISRDQLNVELQYVKDISDWLKNIPIIRSYNTVGNKKRVTFILDLAKALTEAEIKSINTPTTVDFKLYISNIICSYMLRLPVIDDHIENVDFIVRQLARRIESRRPFIEPILQNQNVSNAPDVIEFIEIYIQSNREELIDDELKLEAWSTRVIREIKKLIYVSNPEAFSTTQVYDLLANNNTETTDKVKFFDLKIDYCREISSWLRNLKLEHIDERDKVLAVTNLAEKMTELNIKNSLHPDFKIDQELEECIKNWIKPLNRRQEIDEVTAVKQLMHRMDIAHSNYDYNIDSREKKSKPLRKEPILTSSPTRQSVEITQSLDSVANIVEDWCNTLPPQIQSKDEENIKAAKEKIANKLFHKIVELNEDPHFNRFDLLFIDGLSEELDCAVDEVHDILEVSDEAKKNLLEKIAAAKKSLSKSSAGPMYFDTLVHVLDSSLPNPIQGAHAIDPGFEIYKQNLATIFVLDNFDHGDETMKLQYVKKLKAELNIFFESAQHRNAVPIDSDKMFNELYSALYKVSLPSETALTDEIKEIKIRGVVDSWFEQLLLRPAENVNELLDQKHIIVTLGKRIHEFETQQNSDEKIHKEIVKWLRLLSLQHEQMNNIDELANNLQDLLKSSSTQRNNQSINRLQSPNGSDTNTNQEYIIAMVTGTKSTESRDSSEVRSFIQSSNTSNAVYTPLNSPGTLLLKTIEETCNQIPFSMNTPQEQQEASEMKDDLITQILRKVSELNADEKIFNHDALYFYALDVELEKIISKILSQKVSIDRNSFKTILIENIKSIKPLLCRGNVDSDFKKYLLDVAAKVIGYPGIKTTTNETHFEIMQNDVVDNFLEYQYEKANESNKKFRDKILKALNKYMGTVKEKSQHVDTLLKTNQIIHDLAKIPIDKDVLKNEVLQIRMKNEIAELINELQPNLNATQKIEINHNNKSLVKRLAQIYTNGDPNDEKIIREQVIKTLKQRGVNPSQSRLDDLVNKIVALLREMEIIRPNQIVQNYQLEVTSAPNQTLISELNFADYSNQIENLDYVTLSSTVNSLDTSANICCIPGYSPSLANPRPAWQYASQYGVNGPRTPGNLPDWSMNSTQVGNPGWEYTARYGAKGPEGPGSLLDSSIDTTQAEIPGRQYTSRYGANDSLGPGSLPNTSIVNNIQNEIPLSYNTTQSTIPDIPGWLYASAYGPNVSPNAGTLSNATMINNNQNEMPSLFYNTMNNQAEMPSLSYYNTTQSTSPEIPGWLYASGYGPNISQNAATLPNDSMINNNENESLFYITYQSNSTSPGSLPNYPGSRSFPRAQPANMTGNQQIVDPTANMLPYQPYPFSPPAADVSSISDSRYRSLQQANQRWDSGVQATRQGPNTSGGGEVESWNSPDSGAQAGILEVSAMVYPTGAPYNRPQYISQLPQTLANQQIVDPTANMLPYQPYPFSPPSADISSISDARYRSLLQPNQRWVSGAQNISQLPRTQPNQQIFDPTANMLPYQPHPFNPPSGDISSISDTRYRSLLQPNQRWDSGVHAISTRQGPNTSAGITGQDYNNGINTTFIHFVPPYNSTGIQPAQQNNNSSIHFNPPYNSTGIQPQNYNQQRSVNGTQNVDPSYMQRSRGTANNLVPEYTNLQGNGENLNNDMDDFDACLCYLPRRCPGRPGIPLFGPCPGYRRLG